MNWTHVRRIAWKDYRRMHSLWYSLVGFWALLLITQTVAAFYANDFVSYFSVGGVTFGILAIGLTFSLAWSAVTFSMEHEDQTYGFLRSLPLNAKEVFYGKLLYGLNSTLLLMLVLGLLAFAYGRLLTGQGGGFAEVRASLNDTPLELGVREIERSANAFSAVCILLVTSLGLFWSMKIKRPFLSLIFTGISMVVVGGMVGWLTAIVLEHTTAPREPNPRTFTIITSLAVTCFSLGLLVYDRFSAESWLPNRSVAHPTIPPALPRQVTARPGTGLTRLFWLQRRQKLLLYIGVGMGFLLALVLAADAPTNAVTVGMVSSCVLGLATFRPEHQNRRYRLLAQLGVRPSRYWNSVVVIPGMGVMCMSAVALALSIRFDNLPWGVAGGTWAAVLVASWICGYALGQFWSLASSSSIIASAATLLSSIVAYYWIVLVSVFRVPWWLGLAPIVILPLMATWLRVPRWFRDTRDWRQWVIPVAPVVALVIGLPVITACYRIWEVPAVNVTLPDPAPLTFVEREGQAKYREVFARLPRLQHSKRQTLVPPLEMMSDVESFLIQQDLLPGWLQQHDEVLTDLVGATKVAAVFPESDPEQFGANTITQEGRNAAAVLLTAARICELNKDPGDSWKYYKAALRLAQHQRGRFMGCAEMLASLETETAVYRRMVPWAMLETNSADRIEAAAVFIKQYRQEQPDWRAAMASDLRHARSLLAEPAKLRYDQQFHPWAPSISTAFAPWEWERAKRLCDFAWQEAFQANVASEKNHWLLNATNVPSMKTRQLAHTTLSATDNLTYDILPRLLQTDLIRVGTLYQLVSIGYFKNNGQYPNMLAELKLKDEPLPPSSVDGKMWKLGSDGLQLATELSEPISGPAILSADAPTNGSGSTTAIGHGNPMFLLPQIGSWEAERFARRQELLRDSSWRRPATVSDFGMAIQMGEGGGLGQSSRPLDRYLEILQAADSAVLLTHVKALVRESVKAKEASVLKTLWDDPELCLEFLPELVELVEAAEPAQAGLLAHQITSRIASLPAINAEQESRVAQYFFSRNSVTGKDMRIPIRNRGNGHYYELLDGQSWQECFQAASRRTFRGMRGHLVTITSQQEEQFLLSAFGPSWIWAAGSDAENEGNWKWVSGAEQGQTLYSPEMPNGPFGDSSPQQMLLHGGKGENFLAVAVGDRWEDAAGDVLSFLQSFRAMPQFVVEYDPSLPHEEP